MDAPLLTDDFKEFLRLLNANRVEIMTSIDGVEYDPCQRRAVVFDIDDVSVPVISLEDLKANKRAAGRNRDLADLDNLP